MTIYMNGELSAENYLNPEDLQTPESRREQVMERSQEKRLGLFVGSIESLAKKFVPKSKKGQKLLNFIPGAGDLFMLYKVVRGQEAGKSLTRREQVLYGAAAATGLFAAGLLYSGQIKEALFVDTISSTFGKVDVAAAMIAAAAKKVSEKGPQLAHVMQATGEWLAKKKDALPQIQEMINSSISKLDLESMNFDEQEAGV